MSFLGLNLQPLSFIKLEMNSSKLLLIESLIISVQVQIDPFVCQQSDFVGDQTHDQGIELDTETLHCGIKVAARPHLVLTENRGRFIKVWAKFF